MTRSRRIALAVVVLGAVLLSGNGTALAEGGLFSTWKLPESISTYGPKVDHLWNLILWLTGITFLITEALIVYAMIRFRHKEGAKAEFTHGNHKLELAWTIVPGAILFILAVYQARTWAEVKIDIPEDSSILEVQVFAKQFEWNFRYKGLDDQFGTADDVVAINELHIPVDRPVVVRMRSLDVLHSLFLPHFRFKQDLVPGMTISGWFQATKTTAQACSERNDDSFHYEIACAELCGIEHYSMRGKIIILGQEEFGTWYERESKTAAEYGLPEIWADWDTSAGYQDEIGGHGHGHDGDHEDHEH